VEHIGLSQGRVSAHLACLAGCGYVEARRAGRFAYYTVADPRVADLVMLARSLAADNAAALADCVRIVPALRHNRSLLAACGWHQGRRLCGKPGPAARGQDPVDDPGRRERAQQAQQTPVRARTGAEPRSPVRDRPVHHPGLVPGRRPRRGGRQVAR
jgi:hypothetical protein